MNTKETNLSKLDAFKVFETDKLNLILGGIKLGVMETEEDLE